MYYMRKSLQYNRVFAFNTKLPEMAMLALKDFTVAKKLPPVGFDLIITGSRVQCLCASEGIFKLTFVHDPPRIMA